MDGDALHQQLRKIPTSPPPTEETLGEALRILWNNRKTGLSSLQKSTVQSLLGIHSPQDLDPVLACLRSIIRKSLNFNLADDDDNNVDGSNIQKLFPLGISVHVQTTLTLLLKKHHSLWKEEDQPTRLSDQLMIATSQSMDLFPLSMSQEEDLVGGIVGSHHPAPLNRILPCTDTLLNDNMRVLPFLKSMTWSMEKISTVLPTNRIAIITIKLSLVVQLEDHSCSSDSEVKFRISKDTLEAMLRSLTHISHQLSKSGEPTSPTAKNQNQ